MKITSIVLAGLATVVLLIPLPYGAVDEWALFAFEVAVAFLFLLYVFFGEPSVQAESKKRGKEKGRVIQEKTGAKSKIKILENTNLSGNNNLVGNNNFSEKINISEEDNILGKDNLSDKDSLSGKDNFSGKSWLAERTFQSAGSLYNYHPQNIVARIIFFLLIIFFVVLILQIIPLPSSVVQALSPQKFKIHGESMEILSGLKGEEQRAAWSQLSLAPALSRYEFLKYLAYFLFGSLLLKLVKSRRDIQIMVVCLLGAGLFQAIYGLAEYLGGTNRIFGYTNIWGRGSAFGTFINRDHYAGFLEMIFPLSLGYLLAKADFFALKRGVTFRQKIVWFSQEKLQRTLLLGALTTMIGLGLLFSRSRSGVIIFVIVFFLMMLALSLGAREERRERKEKGRRKRGINKLEWERKEDDTSYEIKNGLNGLNELNKLKELTELKEEKKGLSFDGDYKSQKPFESEFHFEKRNRRVKGHFRGNPGSRRMLRLIRTVTLAIIFIAILIGLRPIIERFTLESFWREARPKFYKLTMQMIADYPLFGTGAGTYIYAYTPYEDQDFHGILHHAHNDYLEMLAEMGLIGGGAIILAAILTLGILFWRWRQLPQGDYFRRGIGLGLIGGIVAILIHSVSDFNLRVPANAVYFISFYIIAWRLLLEKEVDRRNA